MQTFSELSVTNQCVVLADVRAWSGPDAPVWQVVRGEQAEVGAHVARALAERGVVRLDDFGGVAETFLCDGDRYVAEPPRTRPAAAILSFTPKRKLLAEAGEMARAAHAAGYELLVLTLQKDGKFGKVWVLEATLQRLPDLRPTYYEDTNTVIDALKASSVGARVTAVHVQAPGFEAFAATRADRVMTQAQYRAEVLNP